MLENEHANIPVPYGHSLPPTSVELCSVCQTIKFDQIPASIHGCIPHRRWGDLQESAVSCPLCRIVLYMVHQYMEPCRRNASRGYYWDGQVITDTLPVPANDMQAWLYGSWWRLMENLPRNLLMGIGVRLGREQRKPSPLEKEPEGVLQGYTYQNPGSYVRLCGSLGKNYCYY